VHVKQFLQKLATESECIKEDLKRHKVPETVLKMYRHAINHSPADPSLSKPSPSAFPPSLSKPSLSAFLDTPSLIKPSAFLQTTGKQRKSLGGEPERGSNWQMDV
jgi:hypothetical protein